jgi:aspartyl/asparaginyl beta-hydroxylase (cupin superfamily)
MENIVSQWEVIRDEIKNVKTFHHEIGRPKSHWVDLDPETYDMIARSDGWTYIGDTDKKWWNFPIIVDGQATEAALEKTPRTVELLREIPDAYICGYSLLLGQGIISPHFDKPNSDGPNGSVTCHLGLVCPEGNYLIQPNRVQKEEDGKLVSFNHTVTHTAVNLSFAPRVILYMSFR